MLHPSSASVRRGWTLVLAGYSLASVTVAFAQPGAPREPPPGYPPPPTLPPADPYPTELYAPAPAPNAPPAAPPPTVAAAAPAPVAQGQRRFAVGATLATAFDTESVVTAPLAEAAYAVHPRVLVGVQLGFGWLLDNQGLGASTFRVANPQLSGSYRQRLGAWEIRGGPGITAPVAHVPLGASGRLYRSVYNRALAASGMWNQWLWYADRMTVPVELRASRELASGHALLAELTPALVFGATHGASGTDFVGQLAVEAQLRLLDRFLLCPRLQAVLLPSTSIARLQTSAVLRGVVLTKVGRFFASVLFNVDEPLRSVGAAERWGFHLGKEMNL